MSFGYSVSDFLALTQLAYTTVQNARKACSAHDSLMREVSSLHIVLERLHAEVSKPNSILTQAGDNRKQELATLVGGCRRVLRILSQILEKYNGLSEEKRSVTKLWQRVKFGNGEMQDLGKIRSELATYTQAITLFVNLLAIGSQGEVEKYMDSHGAELREIKQSLHWVTASMQAKIPTEKSILTTYSEDDKDIWKAFRRELIREGFSSQMLEKHKRTIQNYVLELGQRGALDDISEIESNNGESAGYRAEADIGDEEEAMEIPEEALVERIALEDTLQGDVLQEVSAEYNLGTTQHTSEESETELDSPALETTEPYTETPATAQSEDSMQETLPISSNDSGEITAAATEVDTDDVIDKLLEFKTRRPGKQVQLQEREILYLCEKAGEIFISQPVLLELEAPIKIVGGIFGQYYDLLRIFELGGYPPEANYLFLGNYINFGKQSIETICLLLAYKIKYPENFLMLRGKHECARLTKIYGFYEECKRRYNSKIWKAFIDCIDLLPFAAVIDDRIFATNSALSLDPNFMERIRRITRPTDIPNAGVIYDLFSSYPDKDITGWTERQERDGSVSSAFGPDVVHEFLLKHDMDIICRSNEVVQNGYEFFAQQGLVTLFSASNYRGKYDNAGAILVVDENLLCSFKILLPKVKKPKKNRGLLGIIASRLHPTYGLHPKV